MRRRSIVGVCAVMLALVSGSGLALAGGWAVTSLDSAPREVVAGKTYTVEYTVRQHGEHPVDIAGTHIQITSTATGEQLQFAGQPTGETGRYAAAVTFPAEGAWEWQVEQGWFGPQELGAVQVQTPVAASSFWTSTATRTILPLAALAALGLLVIQTAWIWRGRREHASPLQPHPGSPSGD